MIYYIDYHFLRQKRCENNFEFFSCVCVCVSNVTFMKMLLELLILKIENTYSKKEKNNLKD